MPERIQKILSAHGIASRREAEKLVSAGRVTIDGIPAVPGQIAQFEINEIAVDGVPLPARDEFVYIMLNKPRGYVTTMNDERSRKTVVSLVADVGIRVYPVGRLDINSEGLLLMTNDGAFANSVAHPSYNKVKTYEAHVKGDVAAAVIKLRRPMEIDSHIIHASSVRLKGHTGNGGLLSIAIHEGRNRQIRKMCAQCGLEVQLLRRVSIGTVRLGSLRPGHWRYLTEEELLALVEK